MAFGLMMIWNWVVGLVLFFPVCGVAYLVLVKKFGKDVVDRLCSSENSDFDTKWLLALAVASLVWEAAYPIMCYMLYTGAKELHNMMHE